MRVRPAREGDRAAWNAFLSSCTFGDFLHDWAWAAVARFDGQPQRRFILETDAGIVAIAAPQVRRLPAGRSFWYVPHGPVLDYDDAAAPARLRSLVRGLRQAAREDRALAVKLEPRIEAGAPALRALHGTGVRHLDTTLQVGQTRLVELSNDETLLARFDKDTRYAIRRAEREEVTITHSEDAADTSGVDALHRLVGETQRRAGFPMPPHERYRVAWRALAGEGRAAIFEARRGGGLLASAMLVVEGDRSFYLFAGSRREARGEPQRYASYALQWAMMRYARARGVRVHDLWGVAPHGAGPDHPWYGVGLFKKGFGGREVIWAGSWDVVIDPTLYRLRAALTMLRGGAARGARRIARTASRRGSAG